MNGANEISAFTYPSEATTPLESKMDKNRVCHTWPVSSIASNSSFLVDTNALKHPDDVRKDFFGKWMDVNQFSSIYV